MSNDRPRFFDDIAGMAGGAMSALQGLREELESLMKARIEETIRKLELVKREQLDAMAEVARNAREAQLAAETRLAAIEARISALEKGAASPPVPSTSTDAIPLPDETPQAPRAHDTPPPETLA